jgi:phenylacetate-CoA ligase
MLKPTPPFDPWLTWTTAGEVLLATHADAAGLAARRSRRLANLLARAARESPLHAQHLRGKDAARMRLQDLPVFSKRELMARFDEWVTDPALHLDDLRRFTADPARIADPYLGRYTVWESSGSSGEPSVFVQDAAALAVYDALEALRRRTPVARLLDPLYLGECIAFVGATGGHFASQVSIERLRRLNPSLASRLHDISFLQPVDRLVAQLQALSPSVLSTYPSAAVMLAGEQLAGRLKLRLKEVWTGGETLSPGMRRLIEQGFGCGVVQSYGASEFLPLAAECARGALHLNSDWVILESVDADGRPVPQGETGASVLLTNLANHVQPLIRYPLGDRVRWHHDACGCGSHLPVIEVEGRSDDTLTVQGRGGRPVRLLPLALGTVLEEEAGLADFQLLQQGPARLRLSTPACGPQAESALARGREALGHFLTGHGVSGVSVQCRAGCAHQLGAGGKLRRVLAAAGPAA